MASTRAAILTEISTDLPDNTTGAITPALVRTVLNDIINSCLTLLDANAVTGVVTFSNPPILTGLTGLIYGNGSGAITVATAAQSKAVVGAGFYIFSAAAVNFNALADTVFPIALPSGFTRFLVKEVRVSHVSTSLTTAQFGLYTAATQGGVNIVAQTLTSITSTAENTNPNAFSATVIDAGTRSYNVANLYFNIGTAQGTAATADVTIIISPLP